MADVIANFWCCVICCDTILTTRCCFCDRCFVAVVLALFMADVLPLMKPDQLDWQKLVFFKNFILL